MPRPSKRTPQVEETILSRLREGTPLAIILRDSDELPCVSTWLDWCHADETLALAYAHAREIGEEVIALQALEISDEEPEYYSTETGQRIDPASVVRAKNRAEIRLKLLAIWNPKKWGAKVDVTTGGKEIKPLDAGDAAVQIAGILATAKGRKDET